MPPDGYVEPSGRRLPSPGRKAQEREWERRRLERLGLDLVDTVQGLVDLKDRADAEEQKVAHVQLLLDRKRELLTEFSRIQQERTEAEKETRASERRLEFEQPVYTGPDCGAREIVRRHGRRCFAVATGLAFW